MTGMDWAAALLLAAFFGGMFCGWMLKSLAEQVKDSIAKGEL